MKKVQEVSYGVGHALGPVCRALGGRPCACRACMWGVVRCCLGCGAAPAGAGLAGLGEAGRPWRVWPVWGGLACQKICRPAGPNLDICLLAIWDRKFMFLRYCHHKPAQTRKKKLARLGKHMFRIGRQIGRAGPSEPARCHAGPASKGRAKPATGHG